MFFSTLKKNNWIDAKLNDWLVNENQFFQRKILFLVTLKLQLQLKALSRLASLPVATYINVYLFSVLIYFSFFPLLYYPPITCYDYYKCSHDKNRYLINSDAMNLRSVWHYQELAYEQVYDRGFVLESLSGSKEQFGDQPGISTCLLSTEVTVKQWAVVLYSHSSNSYFVCVYRSFSFVIIW